MPRAPLENALLILLIVLGVACTALCLDQSGTSVEAQGQLQVQRRIVQLNCRLNEMVQLDGVVGASEICQAGHSVNALMLANLCLEHSSNRYGETVFVWPRVIPRHVLIETELPPVEFVLPVGVPEAVDAGGECNGPLNALILGDHDNVRVSYLSRELSSSLHLSEERRKAGDRRVGQATKEVIGDPVRPRCFVGELPHQFTKQGSVGRCCLC